MKMLPLTQGHFAQVDDEDFERASAHSWHVHSTDGLLYGRRSFRTPGTRQVSKQYLHHFLLGVRDVIVDHRDGDGLNNQKHNLRLSDPTRNQGNTKLRKDNKSGFKGVQASGGIWVARCAREHLGRFEDKEEAALAYDLAAIAKFGDHARTNILKTIH